MVKPLLTPKHLEAFGGIITAYAACEVQIKFCLAAMLDIRIATLFILSEPYTATSLRNVAKSIAKLVADDEVVEPFVELTGRLRAKSGIRNAIAHNQWVPGTRENSIRPVRMNIREGKPDPRGFRDNEPDYLIGEIIDCANDLLNLRDDIIKFERDSGLSAAIDKKTAEIKAEIESAEGIS